MANTPLIDCFLTLLFLDAECVDAYSRDIDFALNDYENALSFTLNSHEIGEVIKMNTGFTLPVPVMVDTYEKYISLKPHDPAMLEEYSVFIEAFIPEWRSYATELRKEAARYR